VRTIAVPPSMLIARQSGRWPLRFIHYEVFRTSLGGRPAEMAWAVMGSWLSFSFM
jgi:hypothetical protein